jgi:hypothetical protein
MNVEKAASRRSGIPNVIDGDRVLVGASGGKDSLTLSRSCPPRRAETPALRVEPSWSSARRAGTLRGSAGRPSSLYRDWACSAFPPAGADRGKARLLPLLRPRRSPHGLRPGAGLQRIALGHHLDDILTTVLMNLVGRGNAEGMEAFRTTANLGSP